MGTKNICKFELFKPSQTFTKIGYIALQSNKHYFLFSILLLTSLFYGLAQEGELVQLPIKAVPDSIIAPLYPGPIKNDSIKTASVKTDSVSNKKTLLLDKIQYKAKDSIILSQKNQKIYLYNEAEIYYQDTELKAGIIIMDYVNNEVYAGRMKDSLGVYSQLPYFKQADNVVIPDSIRFNFDTQKALIFNSRTEQQAGAGQLGSDAMKVYASITKKENDSVYFMSEAKITTAEDSINPDYYIRLRKAKFVPGKKVIAGLSNIYIADVPTPIGLPFAYFPLSVGKSAGLLMPSVGNDPNRGYFLQGGGYYLPIGDNVDLEVTGDFYTNGSWGVRSRSNYAKRYRYKGSFNLRYENLVTSQKGFSTYGASKNWNIQMSHSQDTKASPNSRFSASVNLGSSQYYRSALGQVSSANLLSNNNSSSISYSKTFPAYPSVNMSLTATHTQNTSSTTDSDTDNIQMTLPTYQASLERIYPFAKRDGIKKGILQNINLQYDVNARYQLTTNDEDFAKTAMFDNARFGAKHRIPLSTNFKVAKFFSVSMGGSYEDVWTGETYAKSYEAAESATETGTVVTDTISGFDRYNTYNFNTSIGTTIYGTFNLGEDKKIQAIRHVMRPSISYGYAPSFEKYYDEYINEDNEVEVQYSRFTGTLNGAPSLNKSNSLSFSLANTLEAKVRDKDSTVTEAKKVSLLSNFNVSSGYNFESDSLKINPVSVNGGTTILDNKMSINFSAGLDPYALDNTGSRINTFNINNGGSLFRLTRANVNVGYRIDSEMFKKKEEEEEGERGMDGEKELSQYDYSAQDDLNRPFEQTDEQGRAIKEKDERRDGDIENPLYATSIPWDFNLAYSASYSNSTRQNEFSSHSLMVRGNVQLTPRWKVGGSTGYDFKGQGFTLTQLQFTRKLGSFNMSFNWTPFGTYRRWDFFIGISSSILKDLKWENRSQQ